MILELEGGELGLYWDWGGIKMGGTGVILG